MKTVMKYVRIVLAVVVLLAIVGWTMMLYKDAVIEWWIVPAVTLVVGAATGLHMWRMWRWLTGDDGKWLNYACHVVVTAIMLSWMFFAANDLLADRSTERLESGVVKGHYREERRKTRRVGRRYVATGEKYYVYKLRIELESGESKFITVNTQRYSRVHNGDSLTVPVMDGLLGITVIHTDSIKFKTRPKARRKSRLKYLGGKRSREA